MSAKKKGKTNQVKTEKSKETKVESTEKLDKANTEVKTNEQTKENKNSKKPNNTAKEKPKTEKVNSEKNKQSVKAGEEKSKAQEEIVFKNSKSTKKTTAKSIEKTVDKNNQNKNNTKKDENINKAAEKKEVNKKAEKTDANLKVEDKKPKEKAENKAERKSKKRQKNNSDDKQKKETESNQPEKVDKKNEEKTLEEPKKKNNGKKIAIAIIVLVILALALILSTCFAIVHATKNTIARGVTIKNIDVSNLTYEEAKTKLEEAFDVAIDVNINLTYEDFSYVVTGSDIALSYELSEALNEACNVGRTGNIFQNNYELIFTAMANKNIDVQFKYDEEALDVVVQYVETNVPDLVKQYSYYIEDTNLIIIPGTDGIKVNSESLRNQIIEIIQNRDLTTISEDENSIELAIPYDEVEADDIDIDEIYSEVYSEPQDAYYVEATETTSFEIYEDVDGVDFAISIDEAKEIVAEEGLEQYVIPLTLTPASVTIDDIGIEAFPYQVSTFQTTYDASNTSRSANLKIAADKINGTVLMPGEQFSFNEIVGERTVSEGYQNAAIYENGQVVNGLAGGICQVSSTLYNAVLLANLQVDERYNHSFTTSYVKAGRDATVVYGVKDFKFTNTRQYPIKIEASVGNGVITFTIYGIEEENEYEVKIIPTTTSTIAYSTQTIVDESLAPGTTVVSQAGASGCTVTTRKEVYLNGVLISNEVISNDTYQTMTRIVRVGPTATETQTTEEATDTSAEVTEEQAAQ